MKVILNSFVFLLYIFSLNSNAKLISEKSETIKVSVTMGKLKCKWVDEYAHAGSIQYPKAFLKTSEIKGTKFKHTDFSGVAYLESEFSCIPVEDIISSADRRGKIKVKKTVRVYKNTYQETRNGPITMIDTVEEVRLLLPNGRSLESRKMKRVKF
jgi:hypothetical protein